MEGVDAFVYSHVGIQDLHCLLESRHVDEVDVDYAFGVEVSLAEEASDVLEKAGFAEGRQSEYLDDLLLVEQRHDVEHVLVPVEEWADLVW